MEMRALTDEEIEHIVLIMEERGIGHCKFCQELFVKLKDFLKQAKGERHG